jgi:hypothetical protein
MDKRLRGVGSLADLERLLVANGIDVGGWGQGNRNSVANLWREIQDGESVLDDNPLRRTIHFVQVLIWREGRILIETEQALANGASRARNRPLSEKMQPGESVEMAALRGIEQELGLTAEQVTLLPSDRQPQIIEHPSPSYPGLITYYNIYTMEAAVSGLPSSDFSSDEQSPTDPVRRHYWRWVPEVEARMLF